jgi:hypothetical protein
MAPSIRASSPRASLLFHSSWNGNVGETRRTLSVLLINREWTAVEMQWPKRDDTNAHSYA